MYFKCYFSIIFPAVEKPKHKVSVLDRLGVMPASKPHSGRVSIKDRLGKKVPVRNHEDLVDDDDRFNSFDSLDEDLDSHRNVEIGPRASVIELKNRVKSGVKLKRPVPLMSLPMDADPVRKIVKRSSEDKKESKSPKKSKSKSSSSSRSKDRESRKSPKKSGEEELEERIRRIQAKNAAILQRQKEIENEKKRYGCS